MPDILYGPWLVEVVFGDTQADERFTISGSNATDGVYSKRGLEAHQWSRPLSVSGTKWAIALEFSPLGFIDIGQVGPYVIGDWYASESHRATAYTATEHLVFTFRAEYPQSAGYLQRPDHDLRPMVLTCRNLNPALRPPPIANPLQFTVPRHARHADRPA